MTTRRRFLTIAASTLALPRMALAGSVHTWQGIALGARATIRIDHPDAASIAEGAAVEIARLEAIFSLYRDDSALSRLNRDGTLRNPPFELLECLSLVDAVHDATDGLFDPTIQPLWRAHAEAGAEGRRPDAATLRELVSLTGWEKIGFDAGKVALPPGMALSLNGIAQGYIADRVAVMLAGKGLGDILIDTGEFRALGGHPEGGAWPVRLAAGGTVPLADRSLATSAPLGTTFDRDGLMGHVLDPRSGLPSASRFSEITVTGRSAAIADAVSTASCLMASQDAIENSLSRFPDLALVSAKTA